MGMKNGGGGLACAIGDQRQFHPFLKLMWIFSRNWQVYMCLKRPKRKKKEYSSKKKTIVSQTFAKAKKKCGGGGNR